MNNRRTSLGVLFGQAAALFGLSEAYRARGDELLAEKTTRQWRDAWVGNTSILRIDRL